VSGNSRSARDKATTRQSSTRQQQQRRTQPQQQQNPKCFLAGLRNAENVLRLSRLQQPAAAMAKFSGGVATLGECVPRLMTKLITGTLVIEYR
jgi:hypothetical protein